MSLTDEEKEVLNFKIKADIDYVEEWMKHNNRYYVQTSLEHLKSSIDRIIEQEGEDIKKRHVFLVICPEELENWKKSSNEKKD